MRPEDLLHPTTKGLYCPPGDFYIDPVRQVDRALITHAHADHARPGNSHVMATKQTLDIMAIRNGGNFANTTQAAKPGEVTDINGVKVSFHPAGHVLGSAQIAVEKAGLKIVASGDYKRRHDPTCDNFEVVKCDVFITEATFGLPVFKHPDDRSEIAKLMISLRQFPERTHLVGAYALGKAQRVIALIRNAGYDEPIYIHGAMEKLCTYYHGQGFELGPLLPATIDTQDKSQFAGKIVIGPSSAFADKWARRFADPVSCFASGWMRVRARTKQRGVELPLILSDHADWDELIKTIKDTQASEVWVTHGREEALVRWCEINQIRAKPLNMVGYEEEAE